MRRRLRQPHEDQQKKERQMDAEFDSENPTCRNGPISHLNLTNTSSSSILYRLDAADCARGAGSVIEGAGTEVAGCDWLSWHESDRRKIPEPAAAVAAGLGPSSDG